MSLASLSINRPVLAIVCSILIVLFGAISFNYLGVREFPSIDPPVITVRTNYTGANPDIIESQITEPLEKAINGIAGIRSISSSSNQGSSVITVEFNLSSNLEEAANDVRDKVSQTIRQLPQDIDAPPVVSKADANSDAIVSLTLQSDSRSKLDLNDYAENVVMERLQTIPGVSSIQIWGQKKTSMRLWLNPDKLSSFGLTPLDVRAALDRENIELPGGKIAGDNMELAIKTVGRYSTEEQFNRIVIKNIGTQVVRLQDVGRAVLGPENEESILKSSGVVMIGLGLIPQPGANYIEIADEFYKRYDQIKKDIPADIRLDVALDNTRFVRTSITEVGETLLVAFLLVVLIIFLFFRDWLIAIRPLIDIPVSLIGAFFIMYMAGFSINILTLLAIVLATGLVVDDGIVVTENIFKKLEEGLNPRDAAIKGTNEIFFAVIATSITLAVVFLPIIFIQGFVGRLFREFGVVVAGSVLISAFVSLTLTPVLNVYLQRKNKKHSNFYERTEPFFVRLNTAYSNSLEAMFRHQWQVVLIVFASIVLIFSIGGSLQSELSPLDDRSWMRISSTAPEGSSYDYMDRYMDQVSTMIDDSIAEKRLTLVVTAPGFTGSGAMNSGFVRVILKDPDQRKKTQQQVAQRLQQQLSNLTGAKSFVIQDQTISGTGGSRAGLPVQFILQNQDFDKIQTYLPKFLEEANTSKVFQGVDVNLKFNRPELVVNFDREKAKNLGVSVQTVAQTLQFAYGGVRYGYFTKFGKQYQIIGQVEREHRDDPVDLKSLYVRNDRGELVQLDNLVNVVEQSSPPQLYHYNRYKAATVSAGLAPGRTIGDGIDEMNRIKRKVLDESFTTDLGGPSRDFAESSSNTSFAFILALLLVYLILAAQFESFIDPIIIMFTVPLALAGALITLWYFDQTMNIFSQIGIIVLLGLVTKNGILIVEFANQKREQGMPKLEAVKEAAISRLRPIMMTSFATILGALPIALALGAGAKSRVSMGMVIIGGLLFSGFLTLYVIPVIYNFMSGKKKVHISTENENETAE
ncbi:MAG: acriflavin resistance protein [Bacteroidetes bacterium B1(2017)]|nr:MAG: acriflavin resistance protein [Bacteroidetes bacterium B1(2017)]